MSEAKKRGSGWPIWVTVSLLPILYVLSDGPVEWLVQHGWISLWTYNEVISHFYMPLATTEYYVPAFERLMNWYLTLWGVYVVYAEESHS